MAGTSGVMLPEELKRKLAEIAFEMEETGSEESALKLRELVSEVCLDNPAYDEVRLAVWTAQKLDEDVRGINRDLDLPEEELIRCREEEADRRLREYYQTCTRLTGKFIRLSLTDKSVLRELITEHFQLINFVSSLGLVPD